MPGRPAGESLATTPAGIQLVSMDQPKRRLAAIWFADIVGYTTISSHDEPAAFQLVEMLQRLARDAVAAHEGRIVKFIGDAVLTEFGSAESAVRAAVSLQEGYEQGAAALKRDSKLRIGVHLGEVNATPDGDLYGDGINTAARLQGEAQPGQVLASEDVWRQLRQRPEFRFAPLGAVELKGITTRVDVYDVLFGGRAALASRKASETRPSKRTRTGLHPALRAALILVPLAVGGTLVVQRMRAGGTPASPSPDASTSPPPPTAPVPAAPETVVVVQSAPPPAAPSTTTPTTVAETQPRAAIPAPGAIRTFLDGFVTALSTQPPRAVLARVFPGATPAHVRTLQQMRQQLGDTVRLRLGPVQPRAPRGDTLDVRFIVLATGPGGNEFPIPLEGLIVREGAGFRFTDLRRAPGAPVQPGNRPPRPR